MNSRDDIPSGETTTKKQLRMISVAFKDASLDSPSFRASVNFFQTRVELFEDWLQKTTDFYDHKYKASFEDFQRAKETVLSQLLPSPTMLSNGSVSNQTFTPTIIDGFIKDYTEVSNRLLRFILNEDIGHSTYLTELLSNAIEPYRNTRTNFEYYQTKYDTLLAAYQSIKVSNANVDPNSIKNDVMQLFELHKSYLAASLDLISAISVLQLSFDKFLLDATTSLKENTMFSFKESGQSLDLAPSMNEYLNDYSIWVSNSIEGAKALEFDIQNARKQIFNYTIKRITPSDNIDDYNIRSIRSSDLINIRTLKLPQTSPEKSGWLFMKTMVGKPSRTVWVRRWCFLTNSIFGLFLLSPSKTYVEETDKFGVLLTNVRYDPDEDRKFCFEVRILGNKATEGPNIPKDISLVFQAESLIELKSWLVAFESSKKYAFSLNPNYFQHEIAFKRFSPKYFEFASSTTTTIDQLITTFDHDTKSLTEYLDYSFSEYEVLSLTNMKLFQFQMVMTPICTKMTQLAILSNFFTKGSWFPTAILANIWGTTNWSDYSLLTGLLSPNLTNHVDKSSKTKPLILTKSHKLLSTMNSLTYPSYYPNDLKITDLQFKNLFYLIDQRLINHENEFVLYKFDTFWCPNKKQKFSSTCFVTIDNLYYYMNSMGFICLNRLSIDDIVSVEVDKSTKDNLKMYDVNGLELKSRILFTDRRIIVTKFQYLLENRVSKTKQSLETILKKFASIDKEFQEKKQMEKIALERGKFSVKSSITGAIADTTTTNTTTTNNNNGVAVLEPFNKNKLELQTSFWNIDTSTSDLIKRIKQIETEYSITYKHEYAIPSKGLLHILFGDRSEAFPRCLFLAHKTSNKNVNWNWKEEKVTEDTTQLVRSIQFEVNKTSSFIRNRTHTRRPEIELLTLKQRVIKMIDNKYYEIDNDPLYVKVPFCHVLKISAKYIITNNADADEKSKGMEFTKGSLLHLFYKIEFINSTTGEPIVKVNPFEKLQISFALRFLNSEYLSIRKVIRYYLERIGRHGKVLKSIRICGLIGVSKGNEEDSKANNDPSTTIASTRKTKGYDVIYPFSTILNIFIMFSIYRITNVVFVFGRLAITIVLNIGNTIKNLNRTLVFGLLVSVLYNMFLSGKTVKTYWSVKRVEDSFEKFMEGAQKGTMQRAISIKDLDLLTNNLVSENDNYAFQKYNERSLEKDSQYRQTRQEIAIRRNELLVELRILQNMEREVVQGDYRKFLIQEIDNCRVVKSEMEDVWSKDTKLQGYCKSCSNELERLSTLLL
ncbi:Sip3p NDAI_0F04100 [Naumovozyma dairenensis CBS 421]|uniref:PH domain-containing protein n=1 Tax=Naumovozyma dairenensis (strain ATCC 10597 / BCRC 20456 / CBS 421 / NBRC 0211 / NRRL Y-12639) TaxID=1071378 RepID=G0WD67_NAUDC|nr:hypothetical protein NDAI_0F04100 [Naumovozyma dairenensis CBS 421]CCD25728.1 hypothetical protein NDAI_0F04100 [Naumovozyma dairenensis CBS 421]